MTTQLRLRYGRTQRAFVPCRRDAPCRRVLSPHASRCANLVRAIAAETHGLTTQAARKQFTLPASSNVAHALTALIEDGRVIRTRHGSGYTFDNPFVRGWVVVHALPDLGMRLEPPYIASPSDEYETHKTAFALPGTSLVFSRH